MLREIFLHIDRRVFDSAARCRSESFLDGIIGAVRNAPIAKPSARRQLKAIGEVLFRGLRFQCTKESFVGFVTLTGTLEGRKGNCLGLCSVYAVLGEALGLPLQAVLFEGHIRMRHTGDGTTVDIEPSRWGRIRIREGQEKYVPPPQPLGGRVLSVDEFVGVYYANVGVRGFLSRGIVNGALEMVNSGLELFPEYTFGWINRTLLLSALGLQEEASRSLDQARALRPETENVKRRICEIEHYLSTEALSRRNVKSAVCDAKTRIGERTHAGRGIVFENR